MKRKLQLAVLAVGLALNLLNAQGIKSASTYNGYRLYIHNIQSVDSKAGNYTCDIVNTGRESLDFSLPSRELFSLEVRLQSEFVDLFSHEDVLVSLFSSQIQIAPDKTLKKVQIATSTKHVDALNDIIATIKEAELQKSFKEEEQQLKLKEKILDSKAAGCSDLVLENLTIIDRSKNYVTVAYKLINKGSQPAKIFGSKRADRDAVAIKAYFGGTPSLTRGCLNIGGSFLTSRSKSDTGILQSGEKYEGTLRLETRKMNRYNRFLLIKIDPYQVVFECNEGNNVSSIMID